MDITAFLTANKWFVDAMWSKRPEGEFSDDFEKICHHVLLVYHKDSPLAESGQYQMLEAKIAKSKTDLGLEFDYDDEDDRVQSLVKHMSEELLTKYQYSFEYEQLVTAHIVFMDNSKELRKAITLIQEEDKRLKASEVKGKLIEMNKVLINDIKHYTSVIYGDDKRAGKDANEKIRSGIEALKKR